ncbi:hypothetical protein AMTR_s00046p00156980 [Amborella trichopoda]|uniref:Uncharacterized protein n=1 Tax=Amborella trichopoda TaxID=13333 RepID=U5DC64_AMBTC|nr:hypothetical protein AMTR_s00046p00156980 [Amborella trichopoda]
MLDSTIRVPNSPSSVDNKHPTPPTTTTHLLFFLSSFHPPQSLMQLDSEETEMIGRVEGNINLMQNVIGFMHDGLPMISAMHLRAKLKVEVGELKSLPNAIGPEYHLPYLLPSTSEEPIWRCNQRRLQTPFFPRNENPKTEHLRPWLPNQEKRPFEVLSQVLSKDPCDNRN